MHDTDMGVFWRHGNPEDPCSRTAKIRNRVSVSCLHGWDWFVKLPKGRNGRISLVRNDFDYS